MLAIHEFWVELFPIFQQSYEFVYVFFDIATIIFVIDLFDTRIRSSEEVRTKYKLPILGEIPQFNGDK